MKRWTLTLLCLAVACGADDGSPDDQQGDELGEGLSGRQGCVEEERPISTDETSPEFSEAKELLALVLGEHAADLHWHDGQHTKVSATVANAHAVKVESREDPNFTIDLPRQCVDRVRIELDLHLTSEDGRLDEGFSKAIFERSETSGLNAWVHLKTAELHGAYVRQVPAGGELSALYFSIEFGPNRFAGDVNEETTGAGSTSLSAAVGIWSSP